MTGASSTDYRKTSFRVEERTYRSIKKLVQRMDGFDSVKEFAESSIRDHSREILQLAAGGETLRYLVELLSDIEGIQEEGLEANIEARLGKGNLEKTIYLEIDVELLGIVGDIADHTGCENSTIFRMCLFRRLFRIADNPETPIEYDWNADLLIFAWAEIGNGLNSVKSRFHEILYRRFTLQTEATRHIVKADSQRFKRFAEFYQKELHDTTLLDELRDEYGERAFTNTENLIEEVTSIQVQTDDSGFLDDLDVE